MKNVFYQLCNFLWKWLYNRYESFQEYRVRKYRERCEAHRKYGHVEISTKGRCRVKLDHPNFTHSVKRWDKYGLHNGRIVEKSPVYSQYVDLKCELEYHQDMIKLGEEDPLIDVIYHRYHQKEVWGKIIEFCRNNSGYTVNDFQN